MKELHDILSRLEPAEALSILAPELKKIMAHLDEEARIDFLSEVVGGEEGDKVSSMVDL